MIKSTFVSLWKTQNVYKYNDILKLRNNVSEREFRFVIFIKRFWGIQTIRATDTIGLPRSKENTFLLQPRQLKRKPLYELSSLYAM